MATIMSFWGWYSGKTLYADIPQSDIVMTCDSASTYFYNQSTSYQATGIKVNLSTGDRFLTISNANKKATGFKIWDKNFANDITSKLETFGLSNSIENGVITISGSASNFQSFADSLTSSVNASCYIELLFDSKTTYEYNEYLDNATSNMNGATEIERGENTIVLTADNGYAFDTSYPPQITVDNSTMVDFTISSDNKTATFTGDISENNPSFSNISEYNSITVYGSAYEVIAEYDYKENLIGCKSTMTTDKITEGFDVIELYANKDCMFDENKLPYIYSYLNDGKIEFELSDDKMTASFSGNVSTDETVFSKAETNGVTVYARVVDSGVRDVTINGTLENCTCNYESGETLDDSKPVTITAENGYEFVGTFGLLVYYGESDSWEYDVLTNNGNELVYPEQLINHSIDLNGTYTATKKAQKVGNFACLYLTNDDELTQLSKVRFYDSSTETVDYGTFITSLYKLPFEIPSDLQGDKASIVLGNYDSKVESTKILNYKLLVDGGKIEIPEKYQNVYDFLNTECILHLPNFNKMFINSEYVIGQTLTIKYIIDLYTGNVTANIYSSFIDDIIETQTQQIAENIPFIQKQNNSIVGSISNINKNVIKTAFIEIVRNIPYDSENVFGKETIDYDVIGTKTGYIRVSDVVLNSTATVDEKEEISQILKEGVFINE